MKSISIVLSGMALCGVGAYGFINNINLWGAWVIIGGIIIFTQVD
ncbi:hypothetical protein [Yersinia phage fHe-Yen9-03]|uniref:Uncharacterized protein n=1 Tax=Yersinia phage fHe-Yen9-03 TaxID=2052743 RepID=A0A2C9CYR0_9CAUD|nr:hypothetical protein [Yersinia phage fHe-Yen9-03]